MNNNNNWHIELAKLIKEKDNIEYIGVITGTVVEVNPYKISILGGQAFFSGENLYICKNATEYQMSFELTAPNGTVTGAITHEGIKIGDKVACIATEDNQKLFVIDKVV